MTPTFSGQWPPCDPHAFSKFLFVFYGVVTLLVSVVSLPTPTSQIPGPECGRTTNPKSGYKLQTCLWHGSACSPLGELLQQTPLSSLFGQTAMRPQLHPAQPALWMGSIGLWSLYSCTTAFYSSTIPPFLHALFPEYHLITVILFNWPIVHVGWLDL